MTTIPPNPFKPGSPPGGATGGSRVAGSDVMAEIVQNQRQISQQAQELAELRSKLNHRTHQMTVLQHVAEILAATPKAAQVAAVLQEVFLQEFGARTCAIWILEDGGTTFQMRIGHGLPRSAWGQLQMPAPNPFPDAPIVLFQNQWLDFQSPASLDILRGDGDTALYFVPFENQLLLMGFAVLGLDPSRRMEDDQDSLTILQRQVAVSLYNAWLFSDLGEQRDALRTKTGELEKANSALREADRFKSEFLALTSHELRTPLTGILGFTRLVLDGLCESPEEERRMLLDSYASGKHLLDLLNDILDLAKIESGRLQVSVEPWSLHVLVEELRPIAEAYPRGAKVELLWPDNLAEMPEVLVDPARLRQVLLNILSNALKFTRAGSVRLLVERGFGQVLLKVVDTGIGVSAEDQANLFQKFVQAQGGPSREYGGTGLGLVICKNLVEMMGGTISLFSAGQGQGTTIVMTVPIA